MKDKTKKWLAVAGLLAVCAVLVFGISRVLYHEPDREAQAVENQRRQNFLWRQKHRNRLRQKAQKQRWKSRL